MMLSVLTLMVCNNYDIHAVSEGLYPQNTNMYHPIFNISHTLVGSKIVDHSDVVGASPVGAAPTTSSFSTYPLASIDFAKTSARWETFKFNNLMHLLLEN